MKSLHFRLTLLGLLIFGVLPLAAQGPSAAVEAPAKIIGKIVDAGTNLPLEFATVTLLAAADSSLLDGVVSDIDGSFQLETGPGNYLVKVEYISYQPQWINPVKVEKNNTTIDLGAIGLSPDAQVLEQVEVRAERSQLQMALDKKIFNVGKDLSTTSGNAAEVLDNIPSVTVDIEGNVSLRGNDGVRILVDGKPSGLVGVGGSNGLRSLPANLIERVEVITNPSARYEAEGMAGIINIVLKKDRKQGFNGSFDLSGGNPNNAGAAFNLNYRHNKVNLFSNYGFNYRESPRIGSRYQEFYRGDTTTYVDQTQRSDEVDISHNFRFGADYFVNDKNTLTTSFSYRISGEDGENEIIYRNYLQDFPGNLTSTSTRNEDRREDEPNIEFALNHKKTFQRDGHEWSTSFQFRESAEEQNSLFNETYFDADFAPRPQDLLEQRSFNKESERSYLFQSDYIQPFKEEGKFEAGYRGSFRRIDNDYLVEEFFDASWNALANLSNDFNYDENIHAVYAIVGNKPSRFSYQFGLRLEHSEVLTELLQTEERNYRTYLNLFPSAFFTYDLPQNNSVQLSYSRRLSRPRFWYLNPFFTFSDSRNIRRGNPNLDPEFTDAYELSHIKYWDNASISSSVYYRHTTGVIERIQSLEEENGELITVSQPENLATENAYGMEFIFSADPFKWWRFNGSVNFFRSLVDGTNFREDLQQDAVSWFGRINSRMTIKKSYDVQLRADYRAPQRTTQGKRKGYLGVDLGVSKDIFGEKGTLTVSMRDLFNTRKYRYENFGPTFFSEGVFQRRPRQLVVTLNYRLNQNKRRGGERGGGDFDGGGEEF